MGLLDARQVGDDAGVRGLIRRITVLESQLQQAQAALGGIEGLVDAQAQLGQVVSDLAVQQSDLAAQQVQLTAQQASLAAQVGFLLTQQSHAELWNIPFTPNVGYVTQNPATNTAITWLAYNSSYDCTLNVTTSGTGRLSVLISGQIAARSTATAWAAAFFGLEIRQGGTVIYSPNSGDGPGVDIQGGYLNLTTAGAPFLVENYVSLNPNTTYTLRTRRGYQFSAGGGGLATAQWTGSVITATKLGM